MLLCPLQNTAALQQDWVQKRPYITQVFGDNPQIYKQFGLTGHNGIDFRAAVGTPLFAPCDGIAKVVNDGHLGYGYHIKIRSAVGAKEVVLGHMSIVSIKDGQPVHMGQYLGTTGNSGFSTGPHLHFGLRFLKEGKNDVWKWEVTEYSNGYKGWVNPIQYILTWKGTLLTSTVTK